MFLSNNCLEAAGLDNITEKLMRRRLTFALAAAAFVGNPVLLAYAQAPLLPLRRLLSLGTGASPAPALVLARARQGNMCR
jgi:hypothetical protein